jgi:iron complex transport system ATP-binding protein
VSVLVSGRDLAIQRRLDPASLDLGAGEVVGLIGPNGSGKTSLLNAFAAIPPATGAVDIAGEQTAGQHPDRRQKLLTYLPASRDVAWPLMARDFIDLALPAKTDWSDIAEQFELAPLLARRMDQLSTGERTRVMITRALAPKPRLLLLDEPTANLDPYWQRLILNELRRQAKEDGSAVLLAIHDLRAAVEWSDRLILMDGGRIMADGPPGQVVGSGRMEQVFRLGAEELLRAPRPTADRQSSP